MREPGNPQFQRREFFGGYIAVTRSPIYGVHVQVGRWTVGRETEEAYAITLGRRARAKDEKK